jgi:hypothetical protein
MAIAVRIAVAKFFGSGQLNTRCRKRHRRARWSELSSTRELVTPQEAEAHIQGPARDLIFSTRASCLSLLTSVIHSFKISEDLKRIAI